MILSVLHLLNLINWSCFGPNWDSPYGETGNLLLKKCLSMKWNPKASRMRVRSSRLHSVGKVYPGGT